MKMECNMFLLRWKLALIQLLIDVSNSIIIMQRMDHSKLVMLADKRIIITVFMKKKINI